MKCPNCGAEVREEDKFCGECGENLQREIEIALPLLRKIEIALILWKWGSMITSLVLLFYFWFVYLDDVFEESPLISLILLIFLFPATICLMYKERTKKIKYGLVWVLFPILMLLFGLYWGDPYFAFEAFLLGAIPAIVIDVIYLVIDVIYVYKAR